MAKRRPKVRRMVVREDVSGRGWQLLIGVGVVVLLVGIAAWIGGRHFLYAELVGDVLVDGVMVGGAAVDGAGLLDRLAEENRALRDEAAVYRSGKDLVREVEERVRSENRDLQDRVAELEQALAYYRRVAMPDRGGQGLRIERVDVAATDVAQVWSVSILLMRTGETDGVVEGRLEGSLLADGPAGRIELPLAKVLAAEQLGFQVRYIDDVKAELRLPAGVTPVRLDVAAVLLAPRTGRVESRWPRPAVKTRATESSKEPLHAGQK